MTAIVEFGLFVLLPLMAVTASGVLSTLAIRRINEKRLLLLVAVLLFMSQHQALELFRFIQSGTLVAGPGEALETGANILTAGAVYYAVGVTERQQQLRRDVADSERRYRTLAEKSPLPLLVVRDDKILFANESAQETLGGGESASLQGRTVTELVRPEDRDTFQQHLDRMLGDEQRVVSTEQRWQTLYDEQLHVAVSGGCATYQGQTAAFLLLQDRTEIRRAEASLQRSKERFQTLFEQSGDAIFLIDPETMTIQEANSRAATMLGYERHQLVGISAHDIHPHEVSRFNSFVDRVRTETTLTTDNLSCLSKDGTRIPVEVSAALVQPGDETMILASARDISQRRRKNRQLAVLRRILRHNLRNSMTVIKGALSEIERTTDATRTSVQRALRRADDLLDTAEEIRQLQQYVEQPGDRQTVDLAQLCRDAVEDVRNQYPDATVGLDLPETAWASGTEGLQLAFEHLVRNAIEHGGEDQWARVAITRETLGPHHEGVRVEVTDNGTGIPEKEVVTADLDEDLSELRHGTGFGLHAVAQVVDISGGEIEFDTASVTDGTRVILSLPAPATNETTESAT